MSGESYHELKYPPQRGQPLRAAIKRDHSEMPSVTARVLVAYSASSTFVSTTLEYLLSVKKYTGFDVDYVHVTHQANLGFEFYDYDIIFHNYCSRLCFEGYVSQKYQEKISAFKGVKILSVQDEYDNTNTLKAAIKRLGFDIVLTCVPQDSLEYVYPRNEFPSVEFVTVFTGYVPDDFGKSAPRHVPLSDRSILVGYRGRDIGGRYGILGFEKFEIGRRMKEICDARGLKNDIAMDENSRIYGDAWLEYMGRCRSMLGSESGSNVFDFDGSIRAKFDEMAKANNGSPPSYADFLPFVAVRDTEIDMGQISPRVFECALTRTPMILFKGRYSDAIKPDEHYIALEKDFSNVDEVLKRLDDIPSLEAMTDRAYQHLVASGSFTYSRFFKQIAEIASRHLAEKNVGLSPLHSKTQSKTEASSDGPGFIFRDWTAFEMPTQTPRDAEAFKLRTSTSNIALYIRENQRLASELSAHGELLKGELSRLSDVYNAERERLSHQLALVGQTELPNDLPDSPSETVQALEKANQDYSCYEINLLKLKNDLEELSPNLDQESFVLKTNNIQKFTKDKYDDLCKIFPDLNIIYANENSFINKKINEISSVFQESIKKLPFFKRYNISIIYFKIYNKLRIYNRNVMNRKHIVPIARYILIKIPALAPIFYKINTRIRQRK